ncbi:MAG: MATE family efflux transporter, partial [Lachnospiraceae bacterium]|nr:MATE family efflux transporter [Lachnospiraceae bacterium]
RLKEILRFCYGFECCTASVMTGVLSLAAPALIGIFMQDASIIAVGVPMLRMQQMGMVFTAVVLVTTCTFQSAGKAVGAFLLSVSRQGVLFAAVLLIASRVFHYNGVLMAQAVSDLLTAILAVVLFDILIRRKMGREQMQ